MHCAELQVLIGYISEFRLSFLHHLVSLTWVRNHHQDAVGAVLDNVWDDELEDVDVALHQVKTALALLLSSASRHYHHLGVGGHTVVCRQIDKRVMFRWSYSITVSVRIK